MRVCLSRFYRLFASGVLVFLFGCAGLEPNSTSPAGSIPDASGPSASISELLSNPNSSAGNDDSQTDPGDPADSEDAGESATPTPVNCLAFGEPGTSTHRLMLDAINLYRIQNGLRPLQYVDLLEDAANAHADDLWQRDFFDHINPDGEDPGDRALAVGFCHEYVGENIAAGQSTVTAVMDAWIRSPSHLANLLEPDYVYVGMGYSVDDFGRQYWVQKFAYDVPQLQP
jgi:uncharacterized protein YkwD